MKDSIHSHFEPEYFEAFCSGRLSDVGAAKKVALRYLSVHPKASHALKRFSLLYLSQLARDIYITQTKTPVHRAWLALPNDDRTTFWNATGDGPDDRLYRKCQRDVLVRLESRPKK